MPITRTSRTGVGALIVALAFAIPPADQWAPARMDGTIGNVAGILLDIVVPGAHATELFVESSGVGIGTSNPQRELHLRGNNAVFRMDRSANTAAFMLVRTSPGGTPLKTYVVGADAFGANNGQFVINDLGTAVDGPGTRRMTITNAGEVHFTGTVRAPAVVQTSSARYKTDIEPIANALASVQSLQGVRFNWIENGRPSMGLIAEDVAEVLPEVVEFDKYDGKPEAVNYSAVIAVLLEAIKSQQDQLLQQQAKIDELYAQQALQRTRAYSLEERVTELEPPRLNFAAERQDR